MSLARTPPSRHQEIAVPPGRVRTVRPKRRVQRKGSDRAGRRGRQSQEPGLLRCHHGGVGVRVGLYPLPPEAFEPAVPYASVSPVRDGATRSWRGRPRGSRGRACRGRSRGGPRRASRPARRGRGRLGRGRRRPAVAGSARTERATSSRGRRAGRPSHPSSRRRRGTRSGAGRGPLCLCSRAGSRRSGPA